jgi:hypothetical protein
MLSQTFSEKCPAASIMRINVAYDQMMTTKNCPRLFKFLSTDEFDLEKVMSDIHRDIPEAYHYTKDVIEQVFDRKVNSLREYFDLSDDLISVYGGPPNTRPAHPYLSVHPITKHSLTFTKQEL